MNRLMCLPLAFVLCLVLGNQAFAVTDEQLGNKAESAEKKEKTEKKEQPSKDKEENDKQKKSDEDFTVHKTGEGHGGVPTSGAYPPGGSK